MLWSFKEPDRYWPLTLTAMILSLLNLWMMEYFYSLELVRPFIIFYALYQYRNLAAFLGCGKTNIHPLAAVFIHFPVNCFLSRVYFHQCRLSKCFGCSQLKANPLSAIFKLIKQVLSDLWLVRGAGMVAEHSSGPIHLWMAHAQTLLYLFTFLIVGALVFLCLHRYIHDEDGKNNRPALWALFIGCVAMLLGWWSVLAGNPKS